MKSFSGCWTCRLRRKKCDETHPQCTNCSALHITCHYSRDKPDWMDGAARQEEMAQHLKLEVKRHSRHRHGGEIAQERQDDGSLTQAATSLESDARNMRFSTSYEIQPDLTVANANLCVFSQTESETGSASMSAGAQPDGEQDAQEVADNVLLTFYLQNLFAFLFPFYAPSPHRGGRAWVLEMLLKSPVFQQIALCQSSYFFNLAQKVTQDTSLWGDTVAQIRDVFAIMRQAIQVIEDSSVSAHLHGAVRIMTGIIQIERFEVAILNFDNYRLHLDAASSLFRQILKVCDDGDVTKAFNKVIDRLGPPAGANIPGAEQEAFRFSSALLILDDLIAGTISQLQPQLYPFHHGLLAARGDARPTIDFERIVGCQNWVLISIGDIAALNLWKQRCKSAGDLDVMELVHRAKSIKDQIESCLAQLDDNTNVIPRESHGVLDLLMEPRGISCDTSSVTAVWAHAALLYLLVVVSGWQTANIEVKYHVNRIIDLLTCRTLPTTMLRTMVWPFCIAGCLAEPMQEARFRGLVELLPAPKFFGTIHKALEIMERSWASRDCIDKANHDLTTCFGGLGELVLLV